MRYRVFAPYNVIGGALWGVGAVQSRNGAVMLGAVAAYPSGGSRSRSSIVRRAEQWVNGCPVVTWVVAGEITI